MGGRFKKKPTFCGECRLEYTSREKDHWDTKCIANRMFDLKNFGPGFKVTAPVVKDDEGTYYYVCLCSGADGHGCGELFETRQLLKRHVKKEWVGFSGQKVQ